MEERPERRHDPPPVSAVRPADTSVRCTVGVARRRAEDPDLPQLRRLREGRKREVDESMSAVAA